MHIPLMAETLTSYITERSAQANHVGRHDKILWPSRYEIILKLSSRHNLGRRTGTTRLLRTPSGRRGTGSGWPTAWRGWPPWPSSSTTRASRGPRGSGGTPRFRPDLALLTEGEYSIIFDELMIGKMVAAQVLQPEPVPLVIVRKLLKWSIAMLCAT